MRRSARLLGVAMVVVLLPAGFAWGQNRLTSNIQPVAGEGLSFSGDESMTSSEANEVAAPKAAKTAVAPPKPASPAVKKVPQVDTAYDQPAQRLPVGEQKAKPLAPAAASPAAAAPVAAPPAPRTPLPPTSAVTAPSAMAAPPMVINFDPACCQPGCCPAACDCEAEKPWTLPQPCFLQAMGLTLGGWVDQGYSINGRRVPTDGYNGVQTFNDRDREYMMNQTCLFLKRDVDTGGMGFDWGGRIDVVYGTDAIFLQAGGLETNWDQTEMYQLALPQFYLDVGLNDWTARLGHFYTILGYEVCTVPDNFFYSHSYSMQYGEPFTHTGALFMRKLGEQLSISGGFHRGIDQFDDSIRRDNSLGFLGGVNWTSSNERLSLAFALTASEEGPDNKVTIYSLVGKYKLSENLTYVAQHDYGQASAPTKSEWYSLNQYMLYELNCKWSAGARYEIFRDNDGTRVTGVRPGNTHVGPYQGNFHEATVGLNWKPEKNIIFRPELRWDWFDGANLGSGPAPYAGDRNNQFVVGMDLIVTF